MFRPSIVALALLSLGLGARASAEEPTPPPSTTLSVQVDQDLGGPLTVELSGAGKQARCPALGFGFACRLDGFPGGGVIVNMRNGWASSRTQIAVVPGAVDLFRVRANLPGYIALRVVAGVLQYGGYLATLIGGSVAITYWIGAGAGVGSDNPLASWAWGVPVFIGGIISGLVGLGLDLYTVYLFPTFALEKLAPGEPTLPPANVAPPAPPASPPPAAPLPPGTVIHASLQF